MDKVSPRYRSDTFPNPIQGPAATPIWATKPLQLHVEVVSKPCRTWNGKVDRFSKNLNITMSCLRWTCSRYDQHLWFWFKKRDMIVWNRDMKCDMSGKTWGSYKAVHLQILPWMVWYQWCVLTHALQCHITTYYYNSTVNTCCKNEAHDSIVGIRMTI